MQGEVGDEITKRDVPIVGSKLVALRRVGSLLCLVRNSLCNGEPSSSSSSFASSATTFLPSLWSFISLRYESFVCSSSLIHTCFCGCLATISPLICANSPSLVGLLVVNLKCSFLFGSSRPGVDPIGTYFSPTCMVFFTYTCSSVFSFSLPSSSVSFLLLSCYSFDVNDTTCCAFLFTCL